MKKWLITYSVNDEKGNIISISHIIKNKEKISFIKRIINDDGVINLLVEL